MFEKLGSAVVRRKKFIFALFVAAVIASGGIGSAVFGKLESGGYSDLNSDSAKAFEYLTDVFKVKEPVVVLVVETKDGLTNPVSVASATKLEQEIKSIPEVESTLSYWSAGGAPSLKSSDGNSAFLFIYSKSIAWGDIESLGKQVGKKYDGNYENLRIYASGTGVFASAINKKIADDIKLSEAISIPLTFILLVFVFGGLVASGMPLLVGVSRKKFLGELINSSEPDNREAATIALTTELARLGVWAVRTHAVKAHKDAISVVERLRK